MQAVYFYFLLQERGFWHVQSREARLGGALVSSERMTNSIRGFVTHLWSPLEMKHGQLFWAPEGSRTRKVSVIPKGDARYCGDIEVMGLTPLGGVACAEVLPLEPNPPRP